jgi:hypothetical protein
MAPKNGELGPGHEGNEADRENRRRSQPSRLTTLGLGRAGRNRRDHTYPLRPSHRSDAYPQIGGR